MAYPAPFLRLVLTGTLYNEEEFAYGMAWRSDADASGSWFDAVPPALIEACRNWHQSAHFSQETRLTGIKLNAIGVDGKYIDRSNTVEAEVDPARGSGTVLHPAQVSLAVTLDTGARRGLASRGRFFLPGPALALGTDGRVPAAEVQTLATRTATFVGNIRTALNGDYHLAVMSKVRTGGMRDVETIRIGRVLDTIRSRRTDLDEAYTAPVAVPYELTA